ncbi:MAG: peptide-methionine (S)-S-oxide reductase MsrA [Synechococcaceae cyanobacterium SM2_3_1]|nr:peptide-methionine (S)-S-oxide reductase MsrA [Synechococcaceae cyanobacterium SM2_3_1]
MMISVLLGGVIGLASPLLVPTYAQTAEEASVAVATFAGGCFWCMEPPFDKLEGVLSTTSGYMGGRVRNPSYKDVITGTTGHYEVVQIEYDPAQVSYAELLEVFWRNIDPLDDQGQFCDQGQQYLSAIFTHNQEQEALAQESKQDLETSGRFAEPIATEILEAETFYKAESYHQDYYQKNPRRYQLYRYACGRDQRLTELWED